LGRVDERGPEKNRGDETITYCNERDTVQIETEKPYPGRRRGRKQILENMFCGIIIIIIIGQAADVLRLRRAAPGADQL